MIKKSYNYRWHIIALLFFGTTINYIDRLVIGILKPYISGDLGWSEVSYGYMIMSFQIAYVIGLITTGRLLDKMHHINIKELVWPITVIYLCAGFGGITGGWLSSRLIKSGRSTYFSRNFVFLMCAITAMPVILVTQVHIIWISVILISCAAFSHCAWSTNIFTIVPVALKRPILERLFKLDAITKELPAPVLLEAEGKLYINRNSCPGELLSDF